MREPGEPAGPASRRLTYQLRHAHSANHRDRLVSMGSSPWSWSRTEISKRVVVLTRGMLDSATDRRQGKDSQRQRPRR